MHLTPIGALQIIIGLYLLIARRTEAMLAFTMACTLMGGSAALTVPALGNASIAPGQLAIAFLAVRILLHRNVKLHAHASHPTKRQLTGVCDLWWDRSVPASPHFS